MRSGMLAFFLLFVSQAAGDDAAARAGHPPIPDAHTVAQWNFDELYYPSATLTDAGPGGYDLRLDTSGRTVPGKWGGALALSGQPGYNVHYAEWARAWIINTAMRPPDGQPSGLWGPTHGPKALLEAARQGVWTCEFWLRLDGAAPEAGTVLDFGQALLPGFRIFFAAAGGSLSVENAYQGERAAFALPAARWPDSSWHHAAFASGGPAAPMRCYLDGRPLKQERRARMPVVALPDLNPGEKERAVFDTSRNFELFRQNRFNLSIGEDRRGANELTGAVDEMRFSSVVRYRSEFQPPASFARISTARLVDLQGKAPLFEQSRPGEALTFGARKHLFVDGSILDETTDATLTVNPPFDARQISFLPHGDFGVVDRDGEILLIDPDGYGSRDGLTRVWTSRDGLTFTSPKLGLIEHEGTRDNNLILAGFPMWATFFRDDNPAASSDERYKATAWVANRGIYVFVSPDAIHWRRNETCMLPLLSGGNAETFWDDQYGRYVCILKRDSSFRTSLYPGAGRRGSIFSHTDLLEPWPFHRLAEPYFEGWSLPAVSGEGPIAFPVTADGEVYRTRVLKYPWAPDTYLGFVWRFGKDEVRGTELAVSRDGMRWKTCPSPNLYIPKDYLMAGKPPLESLSQNGLIRRGDEIWQYFTLGDGPHSRGNKQCVRTRQRLDGFVSLDAGSRRGTATTRPLVVAGNRLEVNARVEGSLRAAILDEKGGALPGFSLEECNRLQGDHIRAALSWKGGANLNTLAGRVVRIRFEMERCKLFAFEFRFE